VVIPTLGFAAARVAVAVGLGLALPCLGLSAAEATEGPGQERADHQAASRHCADRPRQCIEWGVLHGNLLYAMRHVPCAVHVDPSGQQTLAGPLPQVFVVATHRVVPNGHGATPTLEQVLKFKGNEGLHVHVLLVVQQLKPVLQDDTPHRHSPPTHCSLTVQCRPQKPQLRTSVCSSTQTPPQHVGLAAGQSSLLQHWLFGMHASRQTFWPLGQLDSQRPPTQTWSVAHDPQLPPQPSLPQMRWSQVRRHWAAGTVPVSAGTVPARRFLRRFFFLAATPPASHSPLRPRPAPANPRSTSRREGRRRKVCVTA